MKHDEILQSGTSHEGEELYTISEKTKAELGKFLGTSVDQPAESAPDVGHTAPDEGEIQPGDGAENIEVEDQQTQIKNYLDKLKDTRFMTAVNTQRNKLSEADKMEVYKGGLSVKNVLSQAVKRTLMGPFYYPVSFATILIGKKNMKTQALMQGAELIKNMIWLGMLDAPAGLSNEQLQQDAIKNQKDINRVMLLAQGVCVVLAPEAVPELQEARSVVKTVLTQRNNIITNVQSTDDTDTSQIAA